MFFPPKYALLKIFAVSPNSIAIYPPAQVKSLEVILGTLTALFPHLTKNLPVLLRKHVSSKSVSCVCHCHHQDLLHEYCDSLALLSLLSICGPWSVPTTARAALQKHQTGPDASLLKALGQLPLHLE